MTSLLLTISFLIHIISLVGLYALFKEIKNIKQAHVDANEIADLFESYLMEIKQENERLIHEQTEGTSPHSYAPPSIKHDQDDSSSVGSSSIAKSNYTPINIEVEDEIDTTFDSKVLQLFSQGYSSEEIAEKLSSGKTEVELIIKMFSKPKHKY